MLVEAVGAVLDEKVPLIYSLLKGLALQLPDEEEEHYAFL